ncbi:hypothetical protein [Nonomuraea sp. NPDC048916]|uniref:hypothetical protein n=1 Tax=Nonomuraea sp. NPDC048916 TaxID=3154232 RepID=UPI0033DD0961
MAEPREGPTQQSWPGLNPKQDEIKFSADRLKNIAKDLERDLERLIGATPGSLRHLSEETQVTYAGTDDWEAGETLYKSLKHGNTYFTEVYTGIVREYRKAIALLFAGAGDYEAVERLMSEGGTGTS